MLSDSIRVRLAGPAKIAMTVPDQSVNDERTLNYNKRAERETRA